jgi:hypothetical protein
MTKLGNPLKVGDVNRYVLRPICKKLGIPHGGMHAFRHGRVSKMQDEEVNEKIIGRSFCLKLGTAACE